MLKLDLHIHSQYSEDATGSPKDIIKILKKKGLQGMAITDHNTIEGSLKSLQIKLGHGQPSWGWNNHFLNPSLSGGGILPDMGSHAIGAIFGILGINSKILKIQTLEMKSGTAKERTLHRTDGINEYYLQK